MYVEIIKFHAFNYFSFQFPAQTGVIENLFPNKVIYKWMVIGADWHNVEGNQGEVGATDSWYLAGKTWLLCAISFSRARFQIVFNGHLSQWKAGASPTRYILDFSSFLAKLRLLLLETVPIAILGNGRERL